MKTLRETTSTTQHELKIALVNIGSHQMVQVEDKKGIHLESMLGDFRLDITEENGKLVVSSTKNVCGRFVNMEPIRSHSLSDVNVYEFEPIASNDDLAKDLLRLKKG